MSALLADHWSAGLICVSLVSPSVAFGQQNDSDYDSFYAGVAVGLSDVEDRYLGISYGDTLPTLQAVAGYRFNWNWSVEATWQTLDEIDDRNVRGSGLDRIDFSSGVDSASLRLRFWIPVSDLYGLSRPLSVYGFAGAHASDIERAATELNAGEPFGETETDYGVTFGGGIVVGIGRLNLRGSAERIELDASNGNIFTATVGLEFYF